LIFSILSRNSNRNERALCKTSGVGRNGWTLALIAWIGVIFFSSTSLAAEWCEEGFHFLSAIILGHSLSSNSSYRLIHLLADKSVHVALFFVLALLLWRILPNAPWKIAAILFCGALVGSASEFLQRFFPGRDPAVRDVLINICGTGIGAAVCLTWVRYRSRSDTLALK
jgi:VanZ family protein